MIIVTIFIPSAFSIKRDIQIHNQEKSCQVIKEKEMVNSGININSGICFSLFDITEME